MNISICETFGGNREYPGHWGLYEEKDIDIQISTALMAFSTYRMTTCMQGPSSNRTYMDTRLPTDPKLLYKIYE